MNTLELVFRAVADVSWRASWLILALLALRLTLRNRIAARIMFAAWVAIALRLLVPVSWTTRWSPFGALPFGSPSAVLAGRADAAPPGSTLAPAASAPQPLPAPAAPFRTASALATLTAGEWATLLWAGGVVLLLLVRAIARLRFARAVRQQQTALPPADAARFRAALPHSGFHSAEILITGAVSSPALYGFLRPQLLFPPGFIRALSDQELEHTIAHEAAHRRRRDILSAGLVHTVAMVHWFNPLAWLLVRLSRADCELACDESVLRGKDRAERAAYGGTLLKIVRLAHQRPLPALALGVVDAKQQLQHRLTMIVSERTSSFARTLVATALFCTVAALTVTRTTRAQPMAAPSSAPTAGLVPLPRDGPLPPTQAAIVYGPDTDGLDALFPNGIAATIGDQTVTVADVRRELQPLIYQLKRESKDQADFDLRVSRLQNSVIGELVHRIVLLKKFHQHKDGELERHIDAAAVDRALEDELQERFGGDRQKFLEYLRERGVTLREYRQIKEDEIIYGYMRAQERKLDRPPIANRAPAPDAFHLRLIELKRTDAETDATLLANANTILARFRNGETFAALAQEYSDDIKRAKGGDWGWMIPSDVKPDFQAVIAPLKAGDISEPILLPEGCFILFIEARR